jgi:hypothetical protein
MMADKGPTENKAETPEKGELWGWKYQGGGFIPGVPQRDISAAEAKEWGIKSHLDSSSLYERKYIKKAGD